MHGNHSNYSLHLCDVVVNAYITAEASFWSTLKVTDKRVEATRESNVGIAFYFIVFVTNIQQPVVD